MDISLYQVTAMPVERVVAQLLEKTQDARQRAVVLGESEEKIEQISHFLWTYAQQSFLTHGTRKDGRAEHQPIWLTSQMENPNKASLLILIDGREDIALSSFERCFDVFDGTHPSFLALAKDRQKKYEQGGHNVVFWRQESSGRWEKEI